MWAIQIFMYARADCRRQRFIPVANQQHKVWLEALVFAGKLYRRKSDRNLAIELGVEPSSSYRSRRPPDKTMRLTKLPGRPKRSVQNPRSRRYGLQFKIGLSPEFLHNRFQAAVIGSIHQHYTYLSAAHYSTPSANTSFFSAAAGAAFTIYSTDPEHVHSWLLALFQS